MLKTTMAISVVAMLTFACDQAAETDSGTANGQSDPVATALASIDAKAVRAHITFLADDLMEGRDAGTRGHELAARYVASQFDLIGLSPAGNQGGFYQSVPLMSTKLAEGSAAASIIRDGETNELDFPDDFISGGGYFEKSTSVTAPLVFVGFGISAPELGYDDLAGVNLQGRIAVILSGAPARFSSDLRAFYGSSTGKAKRLAAAGAVGTISIFTPTDQRRFSWDRVIRGIGSARMRGVNPDGTVINGFVELKGGAALSPAGAAKLFEGAPQTVEEVFAKSEAAEVNSFEFGYSASLSRASEQNTIESPNVVAILEGSDPVLKDEYVVFSAHLDHVGIRQSAPGDDKIYNGAYDNATGTALLIETARAFASMAVRPRRSIIFIAVTAEEKGLLGAQYFAQNPTVPADAMVANVNLDMPVLMWPMGAVIAFGAQHSSMSALVASAAEAEGLSLLPDPFPEQGVFLRSDHYRFVERGIPAVSLAPSPGSVDAEGEGLANFGEFFQKHYHQPSDQIDLPFDMDSAEKFARINFRIGLSAANADDRPTWNAGDFFGLQFGPDRMAEASTAESAE